MKKFFFTTIAYLLPTLALAQDVVLLEPTVVGQQQGAEATLRTYLPTIFQQAIYIVAILAIILLIIAGVRYILPSASAGDKTEAKDMVWRVVVGLILALSGYIILNTINPNLVSLNVDFLAPLEGSSGGSSSSQSGGGSGGGPSNVAADPESANTTGGGESGNNDVVLGQDNGGNTNTGRRIAPGDSATIREGDESGPTIEVQHNTNGTALIKTNREIIEIDPDSFQVIDTGSETLQLDQDSLSGVTDVVLAPNGFVIYYSLNGQGTVAGYRIQGNNVVSQKIPISSNSDVIEIGVTEETQ